MCSHKTMEEIEPEGQELFETFARIHQKLHKNFFQSLDTNLKRGPMMVMLHLIRHMKTESKGLHVSDIAAFMGISVPATTQIITSLEDLEYIQRSMDPQDRRAVFVVPTEKGKEMMRPAYRQFKSSFAGLMDRLGIENTKLLNKLLVEVEEYFESI